MQTKDDEMMWDVRSRRTASARAAGVGLALLAAGTVALLLLGRALATARALEAMDARPAAPDQVLQGLAAAAAGLVLLWLVAGATVAAIATAPGALGRAAERASLHLAPLLVRAVVATLLGGVVASGTGPAWPGASAAAIASASSIAPSPGVSAGSHPSSGTSPGPGSLTKLPDPCWTSGDLPTPAWTPERPAPPTAKPAEVGLVSAAPAARRPAEDHLVVRRGDTLWAIVARHLGPRASAQEIARAWPRWYAANRAVIGPDPDVLQPGQILRPPAAEHAESSRAASKGDRR